MAAMRSLRATHLRAAALLGALAAAVLLVACGGSSESGDEPEAEGQFAAAAEHTCVDAARRDIVARNAPRDSQAAYLRALIADRQASLRQLERLQPPAEAEAAFQRYLAVRREAIAGLEAAVAQADDPEAIERFRADARELVLEAQKLAGDAGLQACAGSLSAGERRAIERTVALSVRPDRARQFCTERSTAPMIANNFSGVADCVSRQSQRSQLDAVTVDQLSGVDGVSANAIVTLSGTDGRARERYELALVYEDGFWRYDAVSQAPK